MKDYYKILQVASDASPEVIQKLMKFCRIKIKDGNIIRAFIKMKNRHITRNRNRKETLGQNHRIEHKRKQHHKAVKLLQEKAAQGLAVDV